jgi:hypothetical protein
MSKRGVCQSVFVAHRHHDAARKERREQIAETIFGFELLGAVAIEFGREARCVMAFGKGDRGRDVAEPLVLVQQPAGVKIPPLGTIEEIVEARRPQADDRFERRAQRFGDEEGVGPHLARRGDERRPDVARHHVCRIAAKTANPQARIMPHDIAEISQHRGPLRPLAIIELGKIGPDRHVRGVGGIVRRRRNDLAVGIAPIPLRLLVREVGVARGVIDDKIHHHVDSDGRRRGDKTAQEIVIRGGRLAAKKRIEPIVALHRVETAGVPRFVERVDVHPIEAHRGDAFQMRRPAIDRADQRWKEVVNARPRFHLRTRYPIFRRIACHARTKVGLRARTRPRSCSHIPGEQRDSSRLRSTNPLRSVLEHMSGVATKSGGFENTT